MSEGKLVVSPSGDGDVLRPCEAHSTALPEDFYAATPGSDGYPAYLVLENTQCRLALLRGPGGADNQPPG